MKTKHFLMLCASTLFAGMLFTACEKNDVEADYDYIENSLTVFKLKNTEYKDYIMVAYKKEKGVVGYPDTSYNDSVSSHNFKKLSNDYFLVDYYRDCGSNVFTDITFDEYKNIWKESKDKDIRDTLNSRVIDVDPYVEIYKLERKDWKTKDDLFVDVEKINALIESGEFFTYEGVERIK